MSKLVVTVIAALCFALLALAVATIVTGDPLPLLTVTVSEPVPTTTIVDVSPPGEPVIVRCEWTGSREGQPTECYLIPAGATE